jgi:hypothetical protein
VRRLKAGEDYRRWPKWIFSFLMARTKVYEKLKACWKRQKALNVRTHRLGIEVLQVALEDEKQRTNTLQDGEEELNLRATDYRIM